jgi:metal transporter CNNM
MSRRNQITLLCVTLCILACRFVSAHSSPDSEAQSDAVERQYHIHDSHGGVAPDHVMFRGSKYTRDDIAGEADLLTPFTRQWYLYAAGTVFCISMAALAAGLTVGLVSIDPFDLLVILSTEEEDCSDEEEIAELRKEKVYAERLMPLVTKHHLLLVTLLVMNSFANELLPLLLDNLVPSWIAVIMSVSAVLLFGEILPSSIFTGKNQLRYASALTPLVTFFMLVLFIIAYPIATVLDYVLGVEDESRLRRSELKSLIRLQTNRPTSIGVNEGSGSASALVADSPTSGSDFAEDEGSLLSMDEMTILHGVLEMKDKTVADATVPIDEVDMLDIDTVLDLNELANVLHQGHSRIPIYEGDRQNIRGVLLVKRLIVVNPEDRRPLRSIATRWPLICSPQMPLLSLLSLFQTGRSHMAIIANDPEAMMSALKAEQPIPPEVKVLGICTLEDVIESLIKTEISDETDVVGVRSHLQHSAAVRKRILRLKSLAARESAPQKLVSRMHTRGQSMFARFHHGTMSIGTRSESKASAAQQTASGLSSPIKRQESGGVAAGTKSPPTESTGLVHSLSRAPTLTYQTMDESKLDLPSTLAIETATPRGAASAADKMALPRDRSFSKLPKTTSNAWTPAAPHALPPHVEAHSSLASSISPQPPRSTGSVLRPRANFSSDALHRRDLDSDTIRALRTASHVHPTGSNLAHPPLHPTSATVAAGASAVQSHEHEDQQPQAEEDPERQNLLSKEASNDL